MKIVTLFGSPRPNGNTATLAKAFMETAESSGADVQSFLLNKLDIKGCQACDICKTKTDHCVIKDDISTILSAVQAADVLVAATPIYFADISAQLKIFVDRCYSFLEPFETVPKKSRVTPGKKFVLITAQNREDDFFAEVCMKYQKIFEILGFEKTYLVRGCNLLKADDIKTKNRQDLMDLARETAKHIVKINP